MRLDGCVSYTCQATEAALRVAFEDGETDKVLVWTETPSNPLLKVTPPPPHTPTDTLQPPLPNSSQTIRHTELVRCCQVTDLAAVLALVKRVCVESGARKEVVTLADATWTTPWLVRPLDLGQFSLTSRMPSDT